MGNKRLFWRWKSTIIDFSKIPDEDHFGKMSCTKKEYIFIYLPLPDEEIHKLYCSYWSDEYNLALHMPKNMG